MSALPKKLQLVIFDLDGTLVDTADEFIPAVQTLRAEHQLPAMDEKRIRASVSNGARALVRLALDIDDNHPDFEQQRIRLLELYSQVLGTLAKPYPGITSLLAALQQGGIRWAIATNKPRRYTTPLLACLRLQPEPASVVCADDIRHAKPHPQSLLHICRQLQCRPVDAIYIGDHQRDIEAGRRAGMYTIAAAYGYIEPGDSPHDWGADSVVNDSRALAELLP